MMGKRRTATRRPTSLSLCLYLALAFPAPAALRAAAVDQLASPLPSHRVLDQTGTLTPQDIALLDARAQAARDRSGGDVLVVLVDSTDGALPRAYATELANRWQVGGEEGRNGILILLAKNDRKAEIVLSKGIDGDWQTGEAKSIMDWEMVPHFRNGEVVRGLAAAVDAVADRILVPSRDNGPAAGSTAPSSETKPPAQALGAGDPQPSGDGVVPPEALTAPPAAAGAAGQGNRRSVPWILLFLAASCAGLLAVAFYVSRRPPVCDACKEPMVLLKPEQEETYLDPGQEMEQKLGSHDYRVWLCTRCHAATLRTAGGAFSGYKPCPQCSYKTLWTEDPVQRYATEYETGLVEIRQSCQQCGYQHSSTRVTPRRPPQRDDDDSSRNRSSSAGASAFSAGASSTSGGSSTSSSSSSSSGGGGGNFSGGGASGSW
jgi:uncharacterized protein